MRTWRTTPKKNMLVLFNEFLGESIKQNLTLPFIQKIITFQELLWETLFHLNMMNIMIFRHLVQNVGVVPFIIIEIPNHPIFIRNSHTIEIHSLIKVLIANVKTFTDNIITNTQF